MAGVSAGFPYWWASRSRASTFRPPALALSDLLGPSGATYTLRALIRAGGGPGGDLYRKGAEGGGTVLDGDAVLPNGLPLYRVQASADATVVTINRRPQSGMEFSDADFAGTTLVVQTVHARGARYRFAARGGAFARFIGPASPQVLGIEAGSRFLIALERPG